MEDIDKVLKALADPSRRELIDRLNVRNGQTLTELAEGLDMTRQAVTQHLGLLETANLISTRRSGREKLHFFNPVPISEISDRWIAKFERPRLAAINAFKANLEEDRS